MDAKEKSIEHLNREVENFNKAIKWATSKGFDFYDRKWRREDDGKSLTNKELFHHFSKTSKYIR
jgi:hypothetical protein